MHSEERQILNSTRAAFKLESGSWSLCKSSSLSTACLYNHVFILVGELCDLILVFFDPMGQALCKRTLNIVEKLNEIHGDRLRFYLSKEDEAGGESDRQVCMHSYTSTLKGETFAIVTKDYVYTA